ncbi:MAG: hypothetical protein JNL33_01205 [Betaproteobacteria bacterium]|nr:hypothetical protein [Betaproteobacteria bacterium]
MHTIHKKRSTQEPRFPSLFGLWTMTFLYALAAALAFQKVVLPHMPALHGALASTAGAAMTAVTLLLLARRRADLAYREVGLMCAAWLGVACLGAAVGGDNVVLALVSVTALIVLVRLHWTTILERTRVVS